MSGNSGVSLIELLIVLALISITAAGAIPSFRTLTQRIRAHTVQISLQQAIEDTRLLALLRRQTLILCGSDNDHHCTKNWENGWLRKTSSGKVLDTQPFHSQTERLHYRLFPAGRSVLVFLSSGWPEVENGTFWYCPEQRASPAWALVLDRTGKTRVLPPGSDGLIRDGYGKVLSCQLA